MEHADVFLLEQGPASFSLTIMMPIKSQSEPPPETLVFKKWREQFHVVYVSDKLWTSDKILLEDKEKSGFLQPVLTTLGIESLKDVVSSFAISYKGTVNHDVGSCAWQWWAPKGQRSNWLCFFYSAKQRLPLGRKGCTATSSLTGISAWVILLPVMMHGPALPTSSLNSTTWKRLNEWEVMRIDFVWTSSSKNEATGQFDLSSASWS